MKQKPFRMIVIGTSSGGFFALKKLLRPLPIDFSVPIVVVRHQPKDSNNTIIQGLERSCQLAVKFAEDGEIPKAGTVYLAPPDFHLEVAANKSLALSSAEPVNHSRPAIDPLFKSAAEVFGSEVLAVVLTGSNGDGANGAKTIKEQQGVVIVQDPDTAQAVEMPMAALAQITPDYIEVLEQIGPLLWTLVTQK